MACQRSSSSGQARVRDGVNAQKGQRAEKINGMPDFWEKQLQPSHPPFPLGRARILSAYASASMQSRCLHSGSKLTARKPSPKIGGLINGSGVGDLGVWVAPTSRAGGKHIHRQASVGFFANLCPHAGTRWLAGWWAGYVMSCNV